MRARLSPYLLSVLTIAGAFALGGCDDDEEEEDRDDLGTLVIDDDRTTGSPFNVHLALGTQTPTIISIGPGDTKILSLVQGTYVVTFDDTAPAGIDGDADDTKESAMQIQAGATTTIEYVAPGDSEVVGPVPRANG